MYGLLHLEFLKKHGICYEQNDLDQWAKVEAVLNPRRHMLEATETGGNKVVPVNAGPQ